MVAYTTVDLLLSKHNHNGAAARRFLLVLGAPFDAPGGYAAKVPLPHTPLQYQPFPTFLAVELIIQTPGYGQGKDHLLCQADTASSWHHMGSLEKDITHFHRGPEVLKSGIQTGQG